MVVQIKIPISYNYIGVFLTFACNLNCSYCINKQHNTRPQYKHMKAKDWIKNLNRIVTPPDRPITIGGGEPLMYREFYKVVNGIDKHINIDLLTNGVFDEDEFMKKIAPDRIKRRAKYASLRISYHPEVMELDPLVNKCRKMIKEGYSVGVWIIDHPRDKGWTNVCKKVMENEGIDCRVKEFLGWHEGGLYGTYKYLDALSGIKKKVECKPSELLIAPNGSIYRCHYDLYTRQASVSHVLSNNVVLSEEFSKCRSYGMCNPCDIKSKFDRYQVLGHCSVEVRE